MKRALLVMLAVALIVAPSVKAQSPAGIPWTCGVDNVFDATTLCIEASEPGMRRYITDIIAQDTTATAGLMQLLYGHGGGVACGVSPRYLFPPIDGISPFVAAGNASKATVVTLAVPLIVPSGEELCVVGDATNSVTVQLVGYTAP